MGRIIFMLEEPSMGALLDGLLRRIFPDLPFTCITHDGKKDLERSIPGKLRAWREPNVHFVILRDNDDGDCLALKEKLTQLCREGGRPDTLVRIVCQELEAWYLAEPEALAEAFSRDNLRNIGNQPRYRYPDSLSKPSEILKGLVPGFRKRAGARYMANCITRRGNQSPSFKTFIDGIERLCQDAGIDTGAEEKTTGPKSQDDINRQLHLL